MARIALIWYLFLFSTLYSWDETPKCFDELVRHFFEPRLVKQSFDLFYVFQSQWSPILTDLKYNAGSAKRIIKERARKMHPNPFDHPFDPEKSKQLFLEVEFEIFRDTMIRNYWYNLEATYGMFYYIRDMQNSKIEACFVAPTPRKSTR